MVGALLGAWWSDLAFTIGLYIVCIGATIEWKAALEKSGRRVSQWPITVAILGMGVATWYGQAEGLIVALLVGWLGSVAACRDLRTAILVNLRWKTASVL